MSYKLRIIAAAACLSAAVTAQAAGYAEHPKAAAFIDRMHSEHGFAKDEVRKLLASAERKQAILDAISRPAEKTKPWHEYRNIFIQDTRIEQGLEFWRANAATLAAAAEKYGVEPAIIVAIIGVETRYGRHMGNYRVIDALTTLGFDYEPRASFFVSELEHFLLLAREQQQDPTKLTGSYAGAMGFGQFIPSSYRRYARDNDGDGFADIWANPSDAIGSVASYFKAHGWHQQKPVMADAKLSPNANLEQLNSKDRPVKTLAEWAKLGITTPAEVPAELPAVALSFEQANGTDYQFGFNNFYVITRYNRSHLYARAVFELSQAIEAAKRIES